MPLQHILTVDLRGRRDAKGPAAIALFAALYDDFGQAIFRVVELSEAALAAPRLMTFPGDEADGRLEVPSELVLEEPSGGSESYCGGQPCYIQGETLFPSGSGEKLARHLQLTSSAGEFICQFGESLFPGVRLRRRRHRLHPSARSLARHVLSGPAEPLPGDPGVRLRWVRPTEARRHPASRGGERLGGCLLRGSASPRPDLGACAGNPPSAPAAAPAAAVSPASPRPASSDFFHEPGAQVFTVVRHRPLAFEVTPDPAPFVAAGCTASPGAELDCKGAKAIAGFGCFQDRLELAPELARVGAGLAYCSVAGTAANAGMPPSGCMIMNRRAVVAVDGHGGFTLLERPTDVAARAAPIDSREKALAVVISTVGVLPIGDAEIPPRGHVYAAMVESTFVDWMQGGFRVHAFVADHRGCGPHPTNAVDTFVSWSGELKELSNELAYDDGDTSCVD